MGNQENPPGAEALLDGRQLPSRQLSSTAQSNLTDNTQKVLNLFFLKTVEIL